MKRIIKLISLLMCIIISTIILLVISFKVIDTIIDSINASNNSNYYYNMMYIEESITNHKTNDNPNIFYSKFNKIIEFSKTISIDRFGYIEKQKNYNPNTFITVLDILAEKKNFNITDYNIRESVVNQKISNLERRFENCNEHETEVLSFIYKNQNLNSFREMFSIIEKLKINEDNIYYEYIKFMRMRAGHYFMDINGDKYIFTSKECEENTKKIIKDIYGDNYVIYPYKSLDKRSLDGILLGEIIKEQIVIPEIKDNNNDLNLKYQFYEEIVNEKEKLENQFKLLNENRLIMDKNIRYENEKKLEIMDINNKVYSINEEKFTKNENIINEKLENIQNFENKIKREKDKIENIKNIYEYSKENKKIDYIIKNNLNSFSNEKLTIKYKNKSMALKAIENYKPK